MPPAPRKTWRAASDSEARKRVVRACDRCRMKKSKCDGTTPCIRCKADNAVCEYGERQRSQEKSHPKGYLDAIERQNAQLKACIREISRRSRTDTPWASTGLDLSDGGYAPLIHDILVDVGILVAKHNSSIEHFEEDLDVLRQRLIDEGAEMTVMAPRRASDGSESDHCPPDDFAQTPSDHQSASTPPDSHRTSFDAKIETGYGSPPLHFSSQDRAVHQSQMYPKSQPTTFGNGINWNDTHWTPPATRPASQSPPLDQAQMMYPNVPALFTEWNMPIQNSAMNSLGQTNLDSTMTDPFSNGMASMTSMTSMAGTDYGPWSLDRVPAYIASLGDGGLDTRGLQALSQPPSAQFGDHVPSFNPEVTSEQSAFDFQDYTRTA